MTFCALAPLSCMYFWLFISEFSCWPLDQGYSQRSSVHVSATNTDSKALLWVIAEKRIAVLCVHSFRMTGKLPTERMNGGGSLARGAGSLVTGDIRGRLWFMNDSRWNTELWTQMRSGVMAGESGRRWTNVRCIFVFLRGWSFVLGVHFCGFSGWSGSVYGFVYCNVFFSSFLHFIGIVLCLRYPGLVTLYFP